jgi:hypothetical protein
MTTVGRSCVPDTIPPLRTTDRVPSCLVYAVPDVVVITDGIDGLIFGVIATAQQHRIEDGLLSSGVHLEQVRKGFPDLA